VPFQQARNAKQVPARGVRVIGADSQPGSAHAAIANSIIIRILKVCHIVVCMCMYVYDVFL
jgi:hypothetical protein